MASCCPLPDCIAFSTGKNNILLINGSGSDKMKQLKCEGDYIICLKCSDSGKLFATCSSSKILQIWNASSWTCLGTREVPKSVTALCFTHDDIYIVVADKTGDVHSYLTDDVSKQANILLSHLSMLLDMVITKDQKYLITADRDEKIRVSHFPNSYHIETYCLGHKDFVNCLSLCHQYDHLLVSGSGDGTIRIWDFQHGALLTTEYCSKPESKDQKPNPISCITSSLTKPVIAVAVESEQIINMYEIKKDGVLQSICTVMVDANPWSLAFDNSNHLWVCQPNETNPVVYFHWDETNKNWIGDPNADNAFLEACNKWDNFKDASSKERKWSLIRKQEIDNMSQYLVQKEERLKATKQKLKIVDFENSMIIFFSANHPYDTPMKMFATTLQQRIDKLA